MATIILPVVNRVRGKNLLRTCLIALLLTSAVLASTVTSPDLAKMYVDPKEVKNKWYPDTFKVNITANVQNLYSWEFTLNFTPSILQVVSVTRGPFLKEVGDQYYGTYFRSKKNNDYGYVSALEMLLYNSTTGEFPPQGVSGGQIPLATIEFQAVGEGVCVLDLWNTELNTLTGGQNDPIPHTVADGLFDNRATPGPPTANFTVTHPGMTIPVAGLPITFDASASIDDGWIASYDWDFGDGTTDSGIIVSHIFAAVGTYTVSLTVTDNDNMTDTLSDTILVVGWLEGGTFPDIIDARPQREPWNEVAHGREHPLVGLVGNPTSDDYEVYVEFTIYSTEEAMKLGTITTETVTIRGGETLELSAIMDLRDTTWRVGPNRGPQWALKYLTQPGYTVFAKCYHSVGGGEFEEGLAAKDFSFTIRGAKHDIAILNLTADAQVLWGNPLEIDVTIANEGGGHFIEPFDLTVTYMGVTNSGTIEVRSTELKGEEVRSEIFTWDTSTVPKGPYIIWATLSILTFEMDTSDNSASCLVCVI